MKLLNKAVISLAVASLFCVAACKKSEKPAGEENAQQPAALMQADNAKWDKADVNGLLSFVPEDTAFVVASTRLLDADNPLSVKVIDYSRKMMAESRKALQNQEDPEVKAQLAKCDNLYKELEDMLQGDLAAIADRMGLDPKFHGDQVAYNIGGTIVVKQSGIVDFKKVSALLDKVFTESVTCAGVQPIPATEVKTGDASWRVYNIEGWVAAMGVDIPKDANGKSIIPGTIAINETNGILTMAAAEAGNNDALAATLKPAAKAITKDALGKIAPDAYAVGYLDSVKAAKTIVDIDQTMQENCKKEIVDIVGNFPRINVTYRVDNDGNPLYNDNTIVLADKAELKKIQDLFVAHADLINDKSLAGVSLNIDVTKAIAYAKAVSEAMAAKNYTCEAVTDLQDAVKQVAGLAADPQAAMFVNGISNLNVSLENLDMKDPANLVIDATASLEGSAVGTLVPMLVGLATQGSPEVAKALTITKGEVSDIDLTAIAQMPIKLKAFLSDNQLVLGTATHDVKAIADAKKADDKTILRVLFDMALVKKISDDVPNLDGINYRIDGVIGTNEDGLTLNWIMKYVF